MLWVNLGLISLTLALAFGVVVVWRPQVAPVGRVVMTLGLQVSGILVVTWLLVERGQALAVRLSTPAAFEATLVAQVLSAALASVELVLVSIAGLPPVRRSTISRSPGYCSAPMGYCCCWWPTAPRSRPLSTHHS